MCQFQNYRKETVSSELRRPSDIFPKGTVKGAGNYGIEKFAAGTRVCHGMFGEGVILSSRDMGGDVLYEVRFDSGQEKKLMATFAKLERMK